eukprot:6202463-Pleurochrysis_carterae.AAC.1
MGVSSVLGDGAARTHTAGCFHSAAHAEAHAPRERRAFAGVAPRQLGALDELRAHRRSARRTGGAPRNGRRAGAHACHPPQPRARGYARRRTAPISWAPSASRHSAALSCCADVLPVRVRASANATMGNKAVAHVP